MGLTPVGIVSSRKGNLDPEDRQKANVKRQGADGHLHAEGTGWDRLSPRGLRELALPTP